MNQTKPGFAKRASRAALGIAAGFLLAIAPLQASAACVGDCGGDGEVTVNEIITMVNIALGTAALDSCPVGDANSDGEITVNEIIQAVNNALNGCPSNGDSICGNGVKEGDEDCDDGGLCVGGTNAGASCTSDEQCTGPGVCLDGEGIGRTCTSDTDCPGSECVKCRTHGGDGCAANCTTEMDVQFDLVQGVVQGLAVQEGTSGAVVNGDPLVVPLAFSGDGQQVYTMGKERAGKRPFVIKSANINLPKIPVSTLACACVRGVAAKTCGGAIFEADGRTESTPCTPGFGDDTCPADKPCAFVHGPGNAATGTIGCNGLEGINVVLNQDGVGEFGVDPEPVEISVSGSGPAGSVRLVNSVAIGTQVGQCTPTFCTESDPPAARGTPQTIPFTTGEACATVFNANDQEGFDLGPFCYEGRPTSCASLNATPPSLSGLSTVGAFPAVDQPTLADISVTARFVAE